MAQRSAVAWLPSVPAALLLTQPAVYETSIVSYFLDKAAEEKIDPIDFAFHETIDGELVGCMSPWPKPQRLVGSWMWDSRQTRQRPGLAHTIEHVTRYI